MRLPVDKPLVYLISPGSITNENYETRSSEFLEIVSKAAADRLPLIQLREKLLSARLVFDLASRIAASVKGSHTRLLINDRVDIAMATGADGVHLTDLSVRADIVRNHVSDAFMIGVSTHTEQQVDSARSAGADFAVFGPVFDTPEKSNPLGVITLQSMVATVSPFPLLAIGGIDETNYRDVLDTGAAGFAAIRFLNNAQNIEKLSRDLNL